MEVIETRKLTKFYGSKVGCRDVDVSVGRGEIFGFLGPNGAGKSTFVKMLTGLLFPTSGEAFILGRPAGDVRIRRNMGYLPENFRFQEWMTGEDLLSFHASLYRMDRNAVSGRINEVLEIVKLKESRKYKIGTYSKGMQQRIGIAGALLSDPDVLFLDEPTSALDPIGRKEVRDIMLMLKSRGKTIFLNSHLLSEIEMVCDSVAIINKGSIIKQGRLQEILEEKITLEVRVENMSDAVLSKLKEIDPALVYGMRKVEMKIDAGEKIPYIASLLVENGVKLYGLTPRRENLENLFINLIGRGE